MPKFTTDVKSTVRSPASILLGSYLIYFFRFAETRNRKAERYLALQGDAPKFEVDTKATSFTFHPVPDTHNQYFIYKSRAHGDKQFQVLDVTEQSPGKYTLGIKSVANLIDVAKWTAEHGDHLNKFKFSTLVGTTDFTPLYWAVTEEGNKYVIEVRDLGSDYRQGEFALEDMDLSQ